MSSERKITVAKPQLDFEVVVRLNESEVRALDAVFGYSPEDFLKGCYEKLGKHYIEPHAKGVISLHQTIRKFTGPAIAQMNVVRTAIKDLP